MKKIFSFIILLIFVVNFSFSFVSVYGGLNQDNGFDISDESDDSEDIYKGSDEDTYLNTFWYGKVDRYQGNFGISI